MSRRAFLAKSTSTVFTSLVAGLVGSSGLEILFGKRLGHVCQIDLIFPANSGYSEFLTDRSQWRQIDEYQQNLQQFKAQGSLVAIVRKQFPEKVQHSFLFNTKSAHDHFVATINSRCAVSDRGLASMGYTFNRNYFLKTV
jgi:hypothetical protein